MEALLKCIQGFIREEDGAAAIEYGLLASLIAVVIIAAVAIIGARLDCVFDVIGDCLDGTSAGCVVACTGTTPD